MRTYYEDLKDIRRIRIATRDCVNVLSYAMHIAQPAGHSQTTEAGFGPPKG